MFWGQAAENLAKHALPTTTNDSHFFLPFNKLSASVSELLKSGDKYTMIYCQGIAIVWVPPSYILVLTHQNFLKYKKYIKGLQAIPELCN